MRLFQQEFISGLNDMEDDNTPEVWRGGSRVGFYSLRFLESRPPSFQVSNLSFEKRGSLGLFVQIEAFRPRRVSTI